MSDEAGEKKSKKTLIFAVIAIIFVILTAILTILLLFSDKFSGKNMNDMKADAPQKSLATKDANLLHIGPLYAFPEPILINLSSQNTRAYLKAAITLELSNTKLIDEITQKIPILKSEILNTIYGRTVEEILTEKGKTRVKNELIERLNQLLVDGAIKNIFFTEFIVQ